MVRKNKIAAIAKKSKRKPARKKPEKKYTLEEVNKMLEEQQPQEEEFEEYEKVYFAETYCERCGNINLVLTGLTHTETELKVIHLFCVGCGQNKELQLEY